MLEANFSNRRASVRKRSLTSVGNDESRFPVVCWKCSVTRVWTNRTPRSTNRFLQRCICSVRYRMFKNKLQPNHDKTETMIVGRWKSHLSTALRALFPWQHSILQYCFPKQWRILECTSIKKKSKCRIKLAGVAYVAGVYSHARCELPYITQVSVVVFVWCLSCTK